MGIRSYHITPSGVFVEGVKTTVVSTYSIGEFVQKFAPFYYKKSFVWG